MNLRAESCETPDAREVESTRRTLHRGLDIGELERLLGDVRLSAPSARVRRLLQHRLFQRRDDLDTNQASELAYRRTRFLALSLGLRSSGRGATRPSSLPCTNG